MAGFDISFPLILLGTIFGLGYALLGIGLVLAYRSSGFINFAHGAVGLVAAAMMSVVVNSYGVPYWLGFVGALIVAALLSAGLESLVVQKLQGAPRVLAMVATLGTGQALLLLALSFAGGGLGGRSFPQPPLFPDFDLTVYVSPSATALMMLSPVVVGFLWLFLQRTRFGLAIRGAADNPDAATLAGVDPRYMAMLSWALAGAIAAFSAVLLLPNQSTVTPDTLGPDFILRGLAVAALARFANVGIALLAGVALGIVEQLFASNPDATGWFEVAVFVVILIGVTMQVREQREDTEYWGSLGREAPLPDELRRIWLVRNLNWVGGAIVALIAGTLPLWISNQSAFVLSAVLALAIVGVSVSFLTGVAGQLSLGQVGVAAIGAVAGLQVVTETSSLLLGIAASAAAGVLVSVAVAVPALRFRGLRLAIVTLAFSLATFSWLLRQDWAFGNGTSSRPIKLVGNEINSARAFYFIALVLFLVVLALASVVRASAFGRSLTAVRDNEAASRVFRISPRAATFKAYAFAGLLAGVGGAAIAFSNSFVTRALFTPTDSINVVSIAVIGGLSQLAGPLLGALYLIGIPGFFDLELSALAGVNAAWLILILEQPRGLAGLFASSRHQLVDQIARWHGVDPAAARAAALTVTESSGVALTRSPQTAVLNEPEVRSSPLLSVTNVTKSFGELVAVNDVSFDVRAGETLGLIGPNGAGKTTLFELVSGFVKPDSGSVVFDQSDVSRLSPESRSRNGLVRSFQNASMFPTMSPREILLMAHSNRTLTPGTSRRQITSLAPSETDQSLELFGLTGLANQAVGSLSTGTRRIVELAANVALRPKLLLLDEPSAGIAQAETEVLGRVIEQIRDTYGITFVVIEHDMPMLVSICDRLIALEVGSIIATGTPVEVQNNEAVIRSYLGDDPAAIARSGQSA